MLASGVSIGIQDRSINEGRSRKGWRLPALNQDQPEGFDAVKKREQDVRAESAAGRRQRSYTLEDAGMLAKSTPSTAVDEQPLDYDE